MSVRQKCVYRFGGGKAEGDAAMKNLLGGKGANLAEMANLGLPVPPGFTITTEVCTGFYSNERQLSRRLSKPRSRCRLAEVGEVGRRQIRRSRTAAARLGALRRARLDARHDGHGPQSRPQ